MKNTKFSSKELTKLAKQIEKSWHIVFPENCTVEEGEDGVILFKDEDGNVKVSMAKEIFEEMCLRAVVE